MSLKRSSSSFFIFLFSFFFLSSHVSSQACQKTCGQIPIKYPLGTGSGCGDPRFTRYITCDPDQQTLTLTTHTGSYPITSVDYAKQEIYVTDPSMSTCACTRPSHGFGLDWDAPFSFHDDTVLRSLTVPAISLINLQVSTCCVYVPLDLGPSFEMDLNKLKCSSYSGFYNLGPGQESHPENWNYGIALKYKFNVFDEYPGVCGSCERSNGACGFNTQSSSFVCNCPGGINTTSDCFFLYNSASILVPWFSREWVMYPLSWFVVWMVMVLR
ncbi:putative wall-associated receptor kinase, galacturonan-binding domain-containing protein [Arabidopsis thaliana]